MLKCGAAYARSQRAMARDALLDTRRLRDLKLDGVETLAIARAAGAAYSSALFPRERTATKHKGHEGRASRAGVAAQARVS